MAKADITTVIGKPISKGILIEFLQTTKDPVSIAFHGAQDQVFKVTGGEVMLYLKGGGKLNTMRPEELLALIQPKDSKDEWLSEVLIEMFETQKGEYRLTFELADQTQQVNSELYDNQRTMAEMSRGMLSEPKPDDLGGLTAESVQP